MTGLPCIIIFPPPQSLYDSVDELKKNKADRTQVEVEVREVSYTIELAEMLYHLFFRKQTEGHWKIRPVGIGWTVLLKSWIRRYERHVLGC